jgi:hypothetical protein
MRRSGCALCLVRRDIDGRCGLETRGYGRRLLPAETCCCRVRVTVLVLVYILPISSFLCLLSHAAVFGISLPVRHPHRCRHFLSNRIIYAYLSVHARRYAVEDTTCSGVSTGNMTFALPVVVGSTIKECVMSNATGYFKMAAYRWQDLNGTACGWGDDCDTCGQCNEIVVATGVCVPTVENGQPIGTQLVGAQVVSWLSTFANLDGSITYVNSPPPHAPSCKRTARCLLLIVRRCVCGLFSLFSRRSVTPGHDLCACVCMWVSDSFFVCSDECADMLAHTCSFFYALPCDHPATVVVANAAALAANSKAVRKQRLHRNVECGSLRHVSHGPCAAFGDDSPPVRFVCRR